MFKKNKKGFTLTELIIVIVIIGILAAVLIPTLSGYVKKARISEGIQNAAMMNKILDSEIIFNDLSKSDLTAADVRYLINTSQDKPLNYNSKVKGYAYWFDEVNKKIVFSEYENIENGINAAEDHYKLEDIYHKHFSLLDSDSSEIAKNIYAIRNINNLDKFDEYKDKLIDLGVSLDHLSQYSPANTLYINDFFQLTTSTVSVTNVVFADGIKSIPAVDSPVVISTKVYIPASVQTIEQSSTAKAFSDSVTIGGNLKVEYVDLDTLELNLSFYDYYDGTYNEIDIENKKIVRIKGELFVRLEKQHNERIFTSNPTLEIRDEKNYLTNEQLYIFKTYVKGIVTGYASFKFNVSSYNSNYTEGCTFEQFYEKMNFTAETLTETVRSELQTIYNSCKTEGNIKIEIK